MDADKDQKQALAVAFQTKRASSAKKKKPMMAHGGMYKPAQGEANAEGGMVGRIMRKHQDRMMAEGGEINEDEQEAIKSNRQWEAEHKAPSQTDDEIVQTYRNFKQTMKGAPNSKWANGGQVGVDNEEPGNNLDEMNEDAILKELYEEDSSPQPEDSNEHGDSAEAPGGSLADRIRAKIRNKI